MRETSKLLLFLGIFLTFPVLLSGEERWQGYTYPSISDSSGISKINFPNFLVSNTGGTGGGFGKGDIRNHLFNVYFWDENLGVACGYGGVFKTEDGGFTWKRLKERGGWYDIGMTGRDEIWLLEGFHGQPRANLYFSQDGGKTFKKILGEEKLKGFADLYVSGNIIWVIGGDFPSWYSLDKGNTWHSIFFHGSHKIAIPGDCMTNENGDFTIYILCDYRNKKKPYLKKSIDSGKTWTNVEFPEEFNNIERAYMWCMFFVDSMRGWIGFSDGEIGYTEDGGKTWERRDIKGCNRDVVALWFDKMGRGFASVLNTNRHALKEALFYTPDGGKNWFPVLSGQKQINGFFGIGPEKIIAVGTQPSLIPNDLVIFLKTNF